MRSSVLANILDSRRRLPGRVTEATPAYLLRKLLRKSTDLIYYLYLMPIA